MPHKDIERGKAYRRKKYASNKEIGIKRDWGTVNCICPNCLKTREISKNQHRITKLTRDDNNYIIKTCRSCSKIKTDGKYKNKVYIKDHQVQLRRKLKVDCINYLGSKCNNCNLQYNGRNAFLFDFHHKDPENKEFYPAAKTKDFEKVKKELDKCELLCVICHREKHNEPY